MWFCSGKKDQSLLRIKSNFVNGKFVATVNQCVPFLQILITFTLQDLSSFITIHLWSNGILSAGIGGALVLGVVFVIGVVFVVGVVFDVASVSCTKIICKKVRFFETFPGKTDLYAEDENHANQFNHSINRHPSNIEFYSSVVPYECIINVFVYICMMVFC